MDALQAMLVHGRTFMAFTFTSIIILKISVMEGRRGVPRGGRRQPPFGCRRQRDKRVDLKYRVKN